MKNIFTKALLAVFCMAAVLTYSMESNAGEEHICEAVKDENSFKASSTVVFDRGETHALKGTYDYVCKVCRNYMGKEEGYSKEEAHGYTSYEDDGHNNDAMTHDFIFRCGACGHRQHRVLVCKYEKTGYHVAPW